MSLKCGPYKVQFIAFKNLDLWFQDLEEKMQNINFCFHFKDIF